MKIFNEEFGHSYRIYAFGYKILLDKEDGDVLSDIYERGFLPYSGSIGVSNRFYLARSARVPLKTFKLSSENRRVLKKFQDSFEVTMVKPQTIARDETALSFMLRYFKERHGDHVVSRKRLLHILAARHNTQVAVYKDADNKIVAYVIENQDDTSGHYWFSFYDLNYAFRSLGMWLMIERVLNAQKAGKSHYYLGTVYGEKALYKTNFHNLEYWNGAKWQTNLSELKNLARTDSDREVILGNGTM